MVGIGDTMRIFIVSLCLFTISLFAACDLRSETAKREMEKFNGTPTPTFAPTPTEAPIDPADVIKADISVQGDMVTVNGYDQKKSVACSKFNQVMISGAKNVVTIKGACRQISVNGDDNQIISDGALEFVLNGGKNTVGYSRYVNGKRPITKDNGEGNSIEKIAASETKK